MNHKPTSLLGHFTNQPFILATGLAAFVHSCWSLATLFSGHQPAYPSHMNIGYLAALAYWIVPAMLISFSLDIGQLATSYEIRNGTNQNRYEQAAKYLTFGLFSMANYFLQWLFIAHHMPALALSEGVRQEWVSMATLLRDASLWVIPAFLPLSTLLYTLSGSTTTERTSATTQTPQIIPVNHAEPLSDGALITEPLQNQGITVYCECGFEKTYQNDKAARMGKLAHDRHCPLNTPVIASNGKHAVDTIPN